MSKYADLHMHTYISSDGQYTPQEIINIAKEKNLKIIAVADHNSTQSVTETIELGKEVGISVIPATELDCHYNGTHLHILGYGININYQPLKDYEQVLIKQDQDNSLKSIEAIEKTGIIVDRDKVYQLAKNNIVIAEMIAEVVLADPRNDDHPLLAEFREGKSRSDNPYVNFYWDLCAQGKVAHIPGTNYITLEEAITMIKEAGGIAIFAHPGNNIKQNRELAIEIYNKGLSGFEVYSSYHDEETTEFYLHLARELDALITVGSDFHGKTKPAIQMGSIEFPDELIHLSSFLKALNSDITLPSEKIVVETIIKQPIENVWAVLTTPNLINEWNSASPDWEAINTHIQLHQGGRYTSRMQAKDGSEGFDFMATITKVNPPYQLEYKLDDNREVITLLESISENETIIIQSFDPESTYPLKLQKAGWQGILSHLKDVAEKITP